jgi:hypoxanthine phosphoribosyltransferase
LGWLLALSNFARYDFQRFCGDIHRLKLQIDPAKYDAIIAIGRGGLIPGVALSHALNLPMYPITFGKNAAERMIPPYVEQLVQTTSKRFLLVEDMVDSGQVLKDLFAYWHRVSWKKLDIDRFEIAVLLNNTDVDVIFENQTGKVRCTYSGSDFSRKTQTDWITYFWEDSQLLNGSDIEIHNVTTTVSEEALDQYISEDEAKPLLDEGLKLLNLVRK